MLPSGSSRSIPMRVSRPPQRSWRPERRVPSPSVTALMTSLPPDLSADQQSVCNFTITGAAADEDGIRHGETVQRLRRVPLADEERRHTERGGIAADARRAVGLRLDRDGAVRGMASIHSMPTEPDARANIPQQLAPARREGGDGQRPHLPLGDLAIRFEPRPPSRPGLSGKDGPPATSIAIRFSAEIGS